MTATTFNDFAATPAPEMPATTDGAAPLAGVLKRGDDRMLEDVGLSRTSLMTPYETFLEETRSARALWNL